MKTKVVLMVLAVAAFQSVALAQQTPTMAAASTKVEKTKIEVTSPLLNVNQPVKKENTTIDRVGGVSSRPWTQTVGWHNGQSTAWNADTHEAQFCVLSFGAEPKVGR